MMIDNSVQLDAHFHLDLYKNYQKILTDTANQNVLLLAVTNTPSVFHFTKNISQKHANVLPAIGLHPELVKERIGELDILLNSIPNEKYIGEIGLDYSNKYSVRDRDLQRKVFRKIVNKCYEVGNRVLSIHSRRAASDVIRIVGKNFPGTVILHWYSGGMGDLDKAIEYNFYFSINSAMMRSKAGQKIISRIPPGQILTETDGPFLEHNNRLAEPRDISDVIRYLSRVWKTDIHGANSRISTNIISAGILS